MSEKPYEIKNTDPAVREDKGPRGTTRWKSENGQYTAGKTFEQEEEYTDKERRLRHTSRFMDEESDTTLIDKTVSDKLFKNTIGLVTINALKKSAEPDEEVFLINSNKWNDYQLGIDYQIGLRTKDRTAFSRIQNVDSKMVVSSLGNDKKYKYSEIKLDLYQTRVNDSGIIAGWGPGSFLNENHQNTHFSFLIPQCDESVESIVTKLKQDPDYMPVITHAKGILVKKDKLQQYVQERILNNENLNALFEAYKSFKGDEFFTDPEQNPLYNQTKKLDDQNYVVKIPIPGEDFGCKIYFTSIVNNGRDQMSIRIKLPTTPFERKTIPCYYNEF